MVERKTLNLVVVGSIPTGGAYTFFVIIFKQKTKKKVIHSRFVRVILAQGPC